MKYAYILCALVSVTAPACNWHECASETVEFELAAPGDAVEIVIEACPDRRGSAELFITLGAEGESSQPLAVSVDGVGIGVDGDGDGWAGGDGSSEIVGSADCDPGRRVTVRRLDSDPGVTFAGTVTIEMEAPPRHSCTAAITVRPL